MNNEIEQEENSKKLLKEVAKMENNNSYSKPFELSMHNEEQAPVAISAMFEAARKEDGKVIEQPVYTKEMQEVGVKIEHGMLCSVVFTHGNTIEATLTYIGEDVFCYIDSNSKTEHCVGSLSPGIVKIEPIDTRTPEQKQLSAILDDMALAGFTRIETRAAKVVIDFLHDRKWLGAK